MAEYICKTLCEITKAPVNSEVCAPVLSVFAKESLVKMLSQWARR